MRAVDIIRTKRDGQALPRAAIEAFVRGVATGTWPDYAAAALLMAIVLRGMTDEETVWLTDAMVESGDRIDLSGIPGLKVGKHSTGGVGDAISLVLVPLAAACGVVVPKLSGRGLGHTGGTLDKLEAIPGFRSTLTLDEFRDVLGDVGCSVIGQTDRIAPVDKKLYALRDVTATVESIPLISSSVMSKKLAEGSDAVVLDVKCGRGAFMKTLDDARALARLLVRIGTAAGVRTEAFITGMDTPLGRAVGNALEIAECVNTLHGRGPEDVEAVVIRLAVRMLQLGGCAADEREAEAKARAALGSGRALDRFRRMVVRHGGDPAFIDDPARLPRANAVFTIVSPASGVLTGLDAGIIGLVAMQLGAGRERIGDPIDPAVGVVIDRKPGERVLAGDPVLHLHYNDAARLPAAAALAETALAVGLGPPTPPAPLVRAWVHAEGEVSYE